MSWQNEEFLRRDSQSVLVHIRMDEVFKKKAVGPVAILVGHLKHVNLTSLKMDLSLTSQYNTHLYEMSWVPLTIVCLRAVHDNLHLMQ